MPRKSRPWFRFYVEACHDPKLRRLKPSERWLWVSVLAIARQSCEPGLLLISELEAYTVVEIADFAALPVRDVKAGMAKLAAAGMVELANGCWEVPRWGERQFESDDVTARVQRSKERRSNVAISANGTLAGTPPETEAENRNRDPDPLSVLETHQEARPQPVEKPERSEPPVVRALERLQAATA